MKASWQSCCCCPQRMENPVADESADNGNKSAAVVAEAAPPLLVPIDPTGYLLSLSTRAVYGPFKPGKLGALLWDLWFALHVLSGAIVLVSLFSMIDPALRTASYVGGLVSFGDIVAYTVPGWALRVALHEDPPATTSYSISSASSARSGTLVRLFSGSASRSSRTRITDAFTAADKKKTRFFTFFQPLLMSTVFYVTGLWSLMSMSLRLCFVIHNLTWPIYPTLTILSRVTMEVCLSLAEDRIERVRDMIGGSDTKDHNYFKNIIEEIERLDKDISSAAWLAQPVTFGRLLNSSLVFAFWTTAALGSRPSDPNHWFNTWAPPALLLVIATVSVLHQIRRMLLPGAAITAHCHGLAAQINQLRKSVSALDEAALRAQHLAEVEALERYIERMGHDGGGLAYYVMERKISYSFVYSMLAQTFSILSVVLPLLFVNSSELDEIEAVGTAAPLCNCNCNCSY